MTESPLSKKLGIKPDCLALVLNAPDGYLDKLEPLPNGVEISTSPDHCFDFVQLFVRNRAEVDQYAMRAIQAVKIGGKLWLAYPKKSSKVKTDITRDTGWDTVWGAGMEVVAAVAIDDTWSALHFKPSGEVESQKNSE